MTLFSLILLLTACGEDSSPAAAQLVLGDVIETEGRYEASAIGSIDGNSYLFTVTVSDDQRAILHSWEIGTNGGLTKIDELHGPEGLQAKMGEMKSIAVVDGDVYVPITSEEEHGGLWVIDASRPTELDSLAFVETEYGLTSVSGSDDLLAVSAQFGTSLLLFDISDPSHPQAMSMFDPGLVWTPEIELAGDRLYAVDQQSVKIIGVSDPASPMTTGSFIFPDTPEFPVAPPTVPTALPSKYAPTGYWYPKVEAAGDLLYLAADLVGLVVLDVSDAGEPKNVEELDKDGWVIDLALQDSAVSTLWGHREQGKNSETTYGVRTFDISDPDAPEVASEVTGLTGLQACTAVRAHQDTIYVFCEGQIQLIHPTEEAA